MQREERKEIMREVGIPGGRWKVGGLLVPRPLILFNLIFSYKCHLSYIVLSYFPKSDDRIEIMGEVGGEVGGFARAKATYLI